MCTVRILSVRGIQSNETYDVNKIVIEGELFAENDCELIFEIFFIERNGRPIFKIANFGSSNERQLFAVNYDELQNLSASYAKCKTKLSLKVTDVLNNRTVYEGLHYLDCQKAEKDGEDVIWLLSGGGAKGCFQAGAIAFLSEYGDEVYPSLICGTSVGAINSLLPAHGWRDDNQYIIRLLKTWLDLVDSTDMFTASVESEALKKEVIYQLIGSFTGFGLEDFEKMILDKAYYRYDNEFQPHYFGSLSGGASALPDLVNLVEELITENPAVLALAIPFLPPEVHKYITLSSILVVDNAIDKSGDFIESAKKIRSLFSLDPIKYLIEKNLDLDRLKNNKEINLRLVSVPMENKHTCWFDKKDWMFHEIVTPSANALTKVGYPHPRMPYLQQVIKHSFNQEGLENLVNCTLASAAIPLAFPPVEIDIEGKKYNAVDGGVRDTLPVQSCISHINHHTSKSTKIVSIYCSPLSRYNSPYLSSDTGEYKGFEVVTKKGSEDWSKAGDKHALDILLSSIGAVRKEYSETDIFDVYADSYFHNHYVDEIVIAPSFGINATAQIDPGLIRIQLAYGWMRAYDRFNLKDSKSNKNSYDNTDRIIRLRMCAWRNETRFTDHGDHFQYWAKGAIPTIRKIKEEIKRLLIERVEAFGVDSLPQNLLDASYSDSWYLDFEWHGPDYNNQPLGNPWGSFTEYDINSFELSTVERASIPSRFLNTDFPRQLINISGDVYLRDHNIGVENRFLRNGEGDFNKKFILNTGKTLLVDPLTDYCIGRDVGSRTKTNITILTNGSSYIRIYHALYDECDTTGAPPEGSHQYVDWLIPSGGYVEGVLKIAHTTGGDDISKITYKITNRNSAA